MIAVLVDFGDGGVRDIPINQHNIRTTEFEDDLVMAEEFYARMSSEYKKKFRDRIELGITNRTCTT